MKNKLKVLLAISLFFINILECSASTNTFEREKLKNYGISKDWISIEKSKRNILKTPAVDAKEKIYDYADILTDEEETSLKEKFDAFSNTINMDMVLVTTDSYYSEAENEEYATDFYDYNDFGLDYPNNSGLIFLRNANEIDPYYAIYTFGDAQLYYNSSRIDTVLDSIYEEIHSGAYIFGLEKAIDIMTQQYHSGISKELRNYKVDEKGYLYEIYTVPWVPVLIFSIIVTLIVLLILIKKNRMVMKAHDAAGYLDKKSLSITIKQDKYITSHTSSYTVSSSSSGGGGFSSSSGSSGGGHGGGGRHG